MVCADMGQADVMEFLRMNDCTYFTEREISFALEKSRCKAVLKSLRKSQPDGFDFKKMRDVAHRWTFVYRWNGVL